METAAGGSIKKPIKRLKDGYRYIPDEENGGWDRISDNSMSDVFATMEFTPKKTKTNSSITRKQSAPSKTYYSAYNPDDVVKGFNALTLGGLNNLSPTLWARRIYDTGKLLNGDMTWSGYTNSWINGNNGLVSLKFSEEHPYLSAGINLVGDATALGGISNPNSIKESLARGKGLIDLSKYGIYDRFQGYRLYNKYLKNNIDNILNLLLDFRFDNGWIKTSDETGSLFLLPTTYTRSEVISSGPTSMRMGFTANPGGRLSRDLVSQGKEAISKLPTGTSISADAHGTSIPSRLSTRKGLNNITKTLFEGVEDSETTLSRMELLLGEEPGSFIRNPYDMSADAHRFFTLEAQKPGRQLVYAGRSGKWNNAAVSNPEIYLWQQAYESGTLSARDYVNNYNNWVKGFGGRPGHVDINGKPYFYHPTIFITHKQGGKMNVLKLFKEGGLIRKMLTAAGGPIYWVRKRLYRNVTPFGYHNPISRTVGAIALNQQDDTRAEENRRIKDSDPDASALDALWATYLNIPENQRRNINSKYGISKTKDGYYRFNNPGMIFNFEQDLSPHGLFGLPGRKAVMMSGILGNYTTGLGRDTKGDYIFYSDSKLNPDGTPNIKTGWDINPYSNTVDASTEETTEKHGQYGQDKKDLSYRIGKTLFGNVEDISMGIGTPVPIYDKIYLDDIYNVKEKDRGGHYLPEITVTGKKKQGGKMNAIEQFKQGSKIHIKKKNRGKFTAYCGGNVTSACIAKAKASGNPTLVKRATFAANARKWKHLNGGIIKALTGIVLGPAPNITRRPIVKEILSYLPITGSIIDTETAIKNPTLSNIGWAAWSTGSDIFGGRILRDLLKALKAYKEAKAATKVAEEALDTHRKTTKNIIARSVREEDQKLVNALQKARELEALKWGELYWNKAITYPVYGSWITNDAGINYLLNHKNGGIIKAETGLSTSSFIDPMIVDYIKAIENPNRVGWNGKIWKAPELKGYDLNLRGYGIDINTNNAARKLTAGRQGQWLTDDEANTLMLDHIRYIMNAANKHIKGFGELPIGRKAALLGMLYRGDSVNKSNINITEPDDTKFFNSVHNYYISKGLKERAANSSKFFKSHENSNNTIPNFNFNNYKDLNYPFKYIQ